jgi:isopentenyl-diphosphate Delta-isomerase
MTDTRSGTAIEQVVLLDDDGVASGLADKATVHGADTPLHLAFSCHVVGPDGRVLVTRRALGKAAFPGVWTNAFCGHPGPDEDVAAAVVRRAERELGLDIDDLRLVLPRFRYRATDAGGVVENEICPVFVARASRDPRPADDEVAEWAWVEPEQFAAAVRATPFAFSPWLALQLDQWPGEYPAAA